MSKKIYTADCIEDGERFITLFKTIETNQDKLYEMGKEEASGWGAECIEVRLATKEDIGKDTEDNIWDMDISVDENLKDYVIPDGPIPREDG